MLSSLFPWILYIYFVTEARSFGIQNSAKRIEAVRKQQKTRLGELLATTIRLVALQRTVEMIQQAPPVLQLASITRLRPGWPGSRAYAPGLYIPSIVVSIISFIS